jgi:hypothetical protein
MKIMMAKMIRAGLVLACLVSMVAPAWAGEVPDPLGRCLNWTYWDGVNATRWDGQTFAPSGSVLTSADISILGPEHIWAAGQTPGIALIVKVWAVASIDGAPTYDLHLGPLLGTGTLTAPVGSGAGEQWVKCSFSPPINVDAYLGRANSLFVAWTTGPGWTGEVPLQRTTAPDKYSLGTMYVSLNGGVRWTADVLGPTIDMKFRTFDAVDPNDMYHDAIDQDSGGALPDDEGKLSGWSGIAGEPSLWAGQSFTPQLPTLTAVEFYGITAAHPWSTMPAGTPITAEIWTFQPNTSDPNIGLPLIKLGSSTRTTPLTDTRLPAMMYWNGRFDFNPPLDVSAYITDQPASLFLALTTPATLSGDLTVGFGLNTYSQGAWLYSEDQGVTWRYRLDANLIPNWDMVFRTYGFPPAHCGDPGTKYLPADLTRDCQVNLDDLAFMAARWGNACDPATHCDGADLDGSNVVDLSDLGILATVWLGCTNPAPPCNYYANLNWQ